MGEAPESGGEIEGHRESLRGQHPHPHQGERTRRPTKEDVVAFPARLMDTGSASPAGEATTPGPRRTINQREWTIFTGEPLRGQTRHPGRQFVERCGQACHTNRVSVTILEREMYTETAAARLLRVAPSTLYWGRSSSNGLTGPATSQLAGIPTRILSRRSGSTRWRGSGCLQSVASPPKPSRANSTAAHPLRKSLKTSASTSMRCGGHRVMSCRSTQPHEPA
jgi:hypothetical protein